MVVPVRTRSAACPNQARQLNIVRQEEYIVNGLVIYWVKMNRPQYHL